MTPSSRSYKYGKSAMNIVNAHLRTVDVFKLLGVAALYFFTSLIVHLYFSPTDQGSIFFLTSGVALAAVLIGGRRYFWAVLLGAFLANLMLNGVLWACLTSALGSSLAALLGDWLIKRKGRFEFTPLTLKCILQIFVWGAFAGAAVSALVGASTLWLSGKITGDSYWVELVNWWMGDVLGIVLMTPLILIWWPTKSNPLTLPTKKFIAEAALILGATALAGSIVFLDFGHEISPPWIHAWLNTVSQGDWMYMFVVWAAVRLGVRGTSLVFLIVTMLGITGLYQGIGFFGIDVHWDSGLSGAEIKLAQLIDYWWYSLILILVGLALVSYMDASKKYQDRLSESKDELDIKLAESKSENEFRLKFAIEGSGDGLWDWNLTESTVFFSTRWKEMLGYAENEVGTSLEEWESRIHPDDKAATLEAVQAYLDGQSTKYLFEHRVRCKNGDYKWILDRGMVVSRDVEGKPLRLIGTHTDINTIKSLESELIKSEGKARSLIENLQVGVLIQSPSAEIISSNAIALLLLGLTENQLLGITSFDPSWNVIHEDGTPFPGDTHPVPQAIATRKAVSDVVMGVYRPVTHDRVWLLVNAVPKFESEGIVEHVVCTFVNISSRKAAEQIAKHQSSLYLSISQCNQAILHSTNQDELFQKICRIIVESGGLSLAWIGLVDFNSPMVLPVASYGDTTGYLADIQISTEENNSIGRGPTGKAIREGRSHWHLGTDLETQAPWQDRVTKAGWLSAAALPISRDGVMIGALTVYSKHLDYFSQDVKQLMEDITAEVCFGLDSFAREQRRE